MANSYFQFKQFTVQQDLCAMKVCTDACLFGALVAQHLQHKRINNILDIGAGTGLLSLMLAQKTQANIDAVEIDEQAWKQASSNFASSAWSARLHCIQTNILSYQATAPYDCIISNPPFFEGDLKSNHAGKNAAKHDTTLTLEQLFSAAKTLLLPSGVFSLLLPFHRMEAAINIAAKFGLSLQQEILVRQTPAHDYFRCILFFGFGPTEIEAAMITIKAADGAYSERFVELLKEYYLYL